MSSSLPILGNRAGLPGVHIGDEAARIGDGYDRVFVQGGLEVAQLFDGGEQIAFQLFPEAGGVVGKAGSSRSGTP